MSDVSLWLLFIGVGVGNFALRLSFIQSYGRFRFPPLLHRALRFVPASVLSALVLPAVIYPGGVTLAPLENPRLWAALVAVLVAWKSRNILLTLIAGMGSLWLFQYGIDNLSALYSLRQ